MQTMTTLVAEAMRHAPCDGMHDTRVPGLTLIRSSETCAPIHTLYRPALCLVLQGAKQGTLGELRFDYDAATFLLVSVDLPIFGSVTQASRERPYLCARLDIDATLLAELALQADGAAAAPASPFVAPPAAASALMLSAVTEELADAMLRLVRLLDRPADSTVMAPLLLRELHYRMLTGEQGAVARRIAATRGRSAQIARAIAWIKDNFAEPFSIERLAGEAGMSASALHQHFKATTALSPLQYQKQMRLHEARRRMLGQGIDAASAGFEVGYDSPSQFSREYARLFGAPPARDVARLRQAA